MNWLRQLWARLFRSRRGAAQHDVNQIDRTLAELRAKVRALPPEQRAAFANEIQNMIQEQAHAHDALNDALEDRDAR